MEEKSNEKQKRTASADPLKTFLDSTQEFFDMWMDSYQSTFGKLTQVPAFGPIREKQEKMMKGFPVYTNLYCTWADSTINFQTIFTEAMKKTYEKMVTKSKGNLTVENYKDFYKVWLDTYSETLKEFTKSGHYTHDMGKLMTHFMDFQKYNKEMIEENILKPGNIPTKTEIDEINKELYTLRKTLKDVDKRVNEVYKMVETNFDTKISELSKKIDGLDKKSEKISEISKKIDDQKLEIKSELDKKITRLDLDKKISEKISEIYKKIKTEIQLDVDKKINEISKKTET